MADESGPWDKYAAPAPSAAPAAEEDGPWSKYAEPAEPDVSAAKNYVEANLNAYKQQQESSQGADTAVPQDLSVSTNQHPAKGYLDALEAGWQTSVSGLITRHQMPDTVLPENADMAMTALKSVGQFAGDIPAMAAGMAAGGAAGSELPVVGNAMGAAAGAWAAPAALRSLYIDQIKKGDISSFSDFFARASGATWEAMKGAVTGAATEGIGGLAAGSLSAAPAISQVAGKTAAQLATMTTVGKAMEGQMPTSRDFVDGAVMLVGLHGLGEAVGQGADFTNTVKGKLQDIYAKTGLKPEDVLAEAQTNPVVKQQLLSDETGIPDQFRGMVETPTLPVDYEGKAAEYDAKVKAYQNVAEPTAEQKEQYTQLVQDRDEHNDQWAEHQKALDGAVPLESETMDAKIPQGMDEQSDVLGKGFAPDQAPQVLKPAEAPEPTAAKGPDLTDVGNTEQTDKEAILSRVGAEDEQGKKFSWDDLRTKTLDDLNPVKQLTDALTGKEKLPAAQDPNVLARLARASGGMAETFIDHGPRDFETREKTGTPSLKQILSPFKDDMDGFKAYAIASRTLELEGRGIETGVPLDEAKSYVDANKGKYEEGFQHLQDFQNDTLKYLRDSGIISSDTYDASVAQNQAYIPFNRIQEGEAGGSGRASLKPIKQIFGSDLPIADPLESIIKNTFAYTKLAEENRAKITLVNLASKSEVGEQYVEKVPTPVRPIQVSEQETAKFMADNGIEGDPSTFNIFRPLSEPLSQDEIAVMRDGKREVYNVGEPVAKALQANGYQTPGMILKALSIPAKMIRTGAIETPDFLARHLIRDQANAFVNSKNGYIPFLDTIRGLSSYFKEDDNYQDWLASGGAMSNVVSMDRDYVQGKVFELSQETGLMDKAKNVLKNPLQIMQAAAEAITSAPRLGEFAKAQEAGKSMEESAYDSRNVTVDNQRMGADPSIRAMSMITAFWNTHVQGMDNLARSFQDDPSGTAAKMALSITLPSVLLWYANKDDERVQDLPHWEKDLFWIVGTKDNIYRIPKPFEQGVLFGSSVERTLQSFYEKDPHAFQGFLSAVTDGAVPNMVPNAVMPAMEQFANRSWLTGGNIVPHSLEGVAPEYQYTPYTSETAKQLGKMISYIPGVKDVGHGNETLSSPMVLENYIRAWTGGMGMYALQVADKGLAAAGITSPPPKPASALSDMPVIRAFVVRYPSAASQNIQDFYDNLDKATTRANTVASLKNRGDLKSAYDYMNSPEAQENMVNLTGVAHVLSEQNKFIQMVNANPTMTPNDKRQLIDSSYYQMINAAKSGNHIMDAMREKQ